MKGSGGQGGAGYSGVGLQELILASSSPYRRTLMERLGVPFRWVTPFCNEEALKSGELGPRLLAERLAYEKAISVAAAEDLADRDSTIIGSDQVVSFGGAVHGKPGTAARAVEQLGAMAGQAHELITALVVKRGERIIRHTNVTTLHMRRLSLTAIERYVAKDQPLDCAGSYKLEAHGIALFERIDSDDHTAVTGLPLMALVTILRDLGFEIP